MIQIRYFEYIQKAFTESFPEDTATDAEAEQNHRLPFSACLTEQEPGLYEARQECGN